MTHVPQAKVTPFGNKFALVKYRAPETSWWADADRRGFTARCRHEWMERMSGSAGERWTGPADVNVLFDQTRKR